LILIGIFADFDKIRHFAKTESFNNLFYFNFFHKKSLPFEGGLSIS